MLISPPTLPISTNSVLESVGDEVGVWVGYELGSSDCKAVGDCVKDGTRDVLGNELGFRDKLGF